MGSKSRLLLTGVCSYFFAALTVAHLALAAALIFARPAAENRRLPALIETTFRPLAFAQRAFCDAEIRARAAALIFRRGLDDPVYVPAKAATAAFNPFNCRATLFLSVLNSAMMSMRFPLGGAL
ncbi:MAG TPA: hypothetical protein VGV15_04000 [Terriglobales bacterium]|nr:hypothetical protein [Terriglobales bacterium]